MRDNGVNGADNGAAAMNRVIGHGAVLSRFSDALARHRMHHAWLLHGMRGIGKHTLAEQMTAMLMCEHQNGCGHCHGCQMTRAGSHPDIHRVGLLEKKRDISIAQVRELLDFLALSGAESERWIVILDDAERLNNQAANALLKGLEEPAAGSVLIIICADIMRLPATVRSRCLIQHCAPLSDTEVGQVFAAAMPELAADSHLCELATLLADGAPGAVAALEDAKVAKALLEWRELVEDLAAADVGRIEAWTRQHVALAPHELIVRAMMAPLRERMQMVAPHDVLESLNQAAMGCLKWPGEVVRHSLRAAPSLLANILALRAALLALKKAVA